MQCFVSSCHYHTTHYAVFCEFLSLSHNLERTRKSPESPGARGLHLGSSHTETKSRNYNCMGHQIIFESLLYSNLHEAIFATGLITLQKQFSLLLLASKCRPGGTRKWGKVPGSFKGERKVARPFRHRFLRCRWDDRENLWSKLQYSNQKDICHGNKKKWSWISTWIKEETNPNGSSKFYFKKMCQHSKQLFETRFTWNKSYPWQQFVSSDYDH